jgi:putative ABC transport system permease protein
MLNDIRVGVRSLLKDCGFTAAAVLTLALGIAANSTIFTIVNAVLLRDLPFTEPDRIVDLGEVSYLDLQDWRASSRTLAGIAAFDEQSMSLSDEEIGAERYLGAYISSNAFALIGQRPILGRDFRPEDDRIEAAPVVILGHDVWRTRYSSDPGVVNRTIRVNGVPATVVGVMPAGFGFPQIAQLWQPLSLLRSEVLDDRDAQFLAGFGKLRPGATSEQASADLGAIAARLTREYPKNTRRPREVEPFRSGVGAGTPVSVAFLFMMGAVGFVLLIACANVANLLLVRAATRSREVSLRMSLGASRWQIVRQLLAESAVLAALAGALALALSVVSLQALWRVIMASGERPPYWLDFAFDGRVFAFLAAVCLGTAILSGLAPAWLTSKINLLEVLNEAGRGRAGSRRGRRWTAAFVVGQLTLTLVLLSGAGLMIRSVLVQMRTDAGIDTSRLITMRLDVAAAGYAPEQRQSLYRQIEERFASISAVTASFASEVPLGGAPERELVTDDQPETSRGTRPVVGQMTIGTKYFEMLGTRPVRGRMFEYDDADASRVAIVNERLAAMYFHGEEAIGRRVRLLQLGAEDTAGGSGADWLTIVGVAPNVRQRSVEGGDFDPIVYVPVGVNPVIGTDIIVRSALDTAAVTALLRQHMREIDPDLPLFNIRTVEQALAFERWAQRFTGSLFSIFAGIALVLAVVGLYAVTAYSAAQRTREIGVRIALGAQGSHVWWAVTRSATAQLVVGLLLGASGSFAISRVLPSQLTGASGSDPVTLIAVAALLVVVGIAACFVPARRAMRLDPVAALRAE